MTPDRPGSEALAEAQRWFARLLAPDCGTAERARFERWRDADPAHAAAFAQVEGVWRRSEPMRQDPAIAAALQDARRPVAGGGPRIGWPALALAAVLLMAVGLLFRHAWLPQEAPAVRYATQLGEQRTITLEDGSDVVLDTASELLVQYGRGERRLTLQRGRADFQVRRDVDRPFVVHAADGTVTALGTRFQVGLEGGLGVVTLLEGQVRVATHEGAGQGHGIGAQRVTLAPGQRIVIRPGGLGERQSVTGADLARARGWTQGNLVVDEWPLRAVLAEMNRYSDTQLRLADPALGEIPISGMFKAGDQQSLALSLEYGWPIRVERAAEGAIVLHRK